MLDFLNGKAPLAHLWGRLAWHPAAQAWMAFARDAGQPERVEVLQQGKAEGTYRLVGVGPRGESIIARRAPAWKAAVERMLCTHVLAHLPVHSPRYYGSGPDGGRSVWLFFGCGDGVRGGEA